MISNRHSAIESNSAFTAKVEDLVREIVIQNNILYYRIESSLEHLGNTTGEDNFMPVIRVITYFEDTVSQIAHLLNTEFDIVAESSVDKKKSSLESFSYKHIQYLVGLKANRRELTEYKRSGDKKFEVQICSMLQDAWAGIEKELGYDSASFPEEGKRDLYRVGALLEMADLEFLKIRSKFINQPAVYQPKPVVNEPVAPVVVAENYAPPAPVPEPQPVAKAEPIAPVVTINEVINEVVEVPVAVHQEVVAPAPVIEQPVFVVPLPEPVYVAPAPVIEQPVVVAPLPEPVYVAPAPVIEQPVVVAVAPTPEPVYVAPAPVVPVVEYIAPVQAAPTPAPAPVGLAPKPTKIEIPEIITPAFSVPVPVIKKIVAVPVIANIVEHIPVVEEKVQAPVYVAPVPEVQAIPEVIAVAPPVVAAAKPVEIPREEPVVAPAPAPQHTFNIETPVADSIDNLKVNVSGNIEKVAEVAAGDDGSVPFFEDLLVEDHPRAVKPAPLDENAPITDASLKEYVLKSKILKEIDKQIAERAGAKINGDIDIEGDVERLRFLKVYTLKQLHDRLKDNNTDIVAFAEKWIGKDNGGSFDSGISLFYLEYLLVGKKNDPAFAVEYVVKFISDNDYSARYIIPTYNSIRNTEAPNFSHLTLK